MESVRPLTDDDVDAEMRTLDKVKDKAALNDIFTNFKRSLLTMINVSENQTTLESEKIELARIKRLLIILPEYEVFMRVKDKVWAVKDRIMNKDAEFFLNRDYSHLIKKDAKQAMIETLISIVKNKYFTLAEEHQNFYWGKGLELLKLIIAYKKLLRDAQ
jgi:hypothetical protein